MFWSSIYIFRAFLMLWPRIDCVGLLNPTCVPKMQAQSMCSKLLYTLCTLLLPLEFQGEKFTSNTLFLSLNTYLKKYIVLVLTPPN